MTIRATDFIGRTVTAQIDRPAGSHHPVHGFLYLLNYGYIPGVMAPDEEELDAYVLGVFEPVQSFTGVCITVVHYGDSPFG